MTDDELIKEGKALAKNFLEVPFLYKDKKKMQIICALVERLKLAEDTEKGLRKSIQVIADSLGVGDEPRCKWITIEIDNLKERLTAQSEVVEAANEIEKFKWYEGTMNQGMYVARVDNLLDKLSRLNKEGE